MLKQFLSANRFLLGVVGVVLLAWWRPEWGREGGPVPVAGLKTSAVAMIFFLQGLMLRTGELRKGVADIRLHLGTQGMIYLVFPAAAALLLLVPCAIPDDASLIRGFVYLSILPTTIASATAFTGMAGGNVVGSLFNTVVSNSLGVVVIPIATIVLFSYADAGGSAAALLLGDIVKLILLPLVLGQAVRGLTRAALDRFAGWFKGLVTAGIVVILYASFCGSFSDDGFGTVSAFWILRVALLSFLLLLAATGLAWFLGAILEIDRPSRISLLYCGSQKTLAAGLPIAALAFSNLGGTDVNFSFFVLPLICYHPMQLILASLLVAPLKRWSTDIEV